MSMKFRTTVHDLDASHPNCPRCGRPYAQVAYYTGKLISAEKMNQNMTVRLTSKYTNVVHHIGGFCRFCDKDKQMKKIPKVILITLISAVLCGIGAMMASGAIEFDRFKYGGLEILLIAIGGPILLYGLIYIIVSCTINPASHLNYYTLFRTFVNRLRKEGGTLFDKSYLPDDTKWEQRK